MSQTIQVNQPVIGIYPHKGVLSDKFNLIICKKDGTFHKMGTEEKEFSPVMARNQSASEKQFDAGYVYYGFYITVKNNKFYVYSDNKDTKFIFDHVEGENIKFYFQSRTHVYAESIWAAYDSHIYYINLYDGINAQDFHFAQKIKYMSNAPYSGKVYLVFGDNRIGVINYNDNLDHKTINATFDEFSSVNENMVINGPIFTSHDNKLFTINGLNINRVIFDTNSAIKTFQQSPYGQYEEKQDKYYSSDDKLISEKFINADMSKLTIFNFHSKKFTSLIIKREPNALVIKDNHLFTSYETGEVVILEF